MKRSPETQRQHDIAAIREQRYEHARKLDHSMLSAVLGISLEQWQALPDEDRADIEEFMHNAEARLHAHENPLHKELVRMESQRGELEKHRDAIESIVSTETSRYLQLTQFPLDADTISRRHAPEIRRRVHIAISDYIRNLTLNDQSSRDLDRRFARLLDGARYKLADHYANELSSALSGRESESWREIDKIFESALDTAVTYLQTSRIEIHDATHVLAKLDISGSTEARSRFEQDISDRDKELKPDVLLEELYPFLYTVDPTNSELTPLAFFDQDQHSRLQDGFDERMEYAMRAIKETPEEERTRVQGHRLDWAELVSQPVSAEVDERMLAYEQYVMHILIDIADDNGHEPTDQEVDDIYKAFEEFSQNRPPEYEALLRRVMSGEMKTNPNLLVEHMLSVIRKPENAKKLQIVE